MTRRERVLTAASRTGVSVRDVVEHVAFETPFTVDEIMGHNTRRYLREVRLVAILLAWERAGLSAALLRLVFERPIKHRLWLAGWLRDADPEFRRLTDLVGQALQSLHKEQTA